SERSEESRVPCGDKHFQPWIHHLAQNCARDASTDIGKVLSGKHRERSGILRCAQNDTKIERPAKKTPKNSVVRE
ncbi:hypothetical protein, partial [Candidatus Binatus sp.]|uniref:hypothetical protein n=1 Tax=Candidatus Binatus sp. TaxID=2811406 RepID=UPI003C358FAD